jgi:hypothetical protein
MFADFIKETAMKTKRGMDMRWGILLGLILLLPAPASPRDGRDLAVIPNQLSLMGGALDLPPADSGNANPDSNFHCDAGLQGYFFAYSLCVRQEPAEKAKLLRIVLSNCFIGSASVYPTYRKPFDMILGAAKRKEWYARGDSNTRPLAS